MKRRTILALTAATVLTALVPVQAQRTRLIPLDTLAHQLSDSLREAQELLNRGGRPPARERERDSRWEPDPDRRRLQQLLSNAQIDARELENRLRDQNQSQRREPLRDREVEELAFTIRRTRNGNDQVRLVRDVAQTSWVTTRQLQQILAPISRPRDEEEAAVLLYPRLTDPDRFYQIEHTLKADYSWKTICRRLGFRW